MINLGQCDPVICDVGGISGHLWHCPVCDVHLTSLFLCPECGVRYDTAFRDVARSLRLAVVQQAYDLGRVTKEEARELLSGPLSPGDDTTIVDDSNQLVVRATCPDCGASVPADGNCWYCENHPAVAGSENGIREPRKEDRMQNDACFKIYGIYVDFVSSSGGLWSVFFNNERVESGLISKRSAYEWFMFNKQRLLGSKIGK